MGHLAWSIWGDFKMRTVLVVLSWALIASCYAVKAMSIDTGRTEVIPYALKGRPIGVDSNDSLVLDIHNDIRLPVQSHLQPGVVTRHAIPHPPGFSYALFVVGDDEDSRDWLRANKDLLQKIQALGFVTNVHEMSHLHALEQLAGMPLQPVDIDGLSALLQVEHYPYVLNEGMVWQ